METAGPWWLSPRRAMGLRKEALAGGGGGNAAAGKDGKMTISSICSFLQDEWRAHEAAKNQWHKERKTIMVHPHPPPFKPTLSMR